LNVCIRRKKQHFHFHSRKKCPTIWNLDEKKREYRIGGSFIRETIFAN